MKKSLEKKLKGLNVAIVAHIFATGPALDLEEYLKNKVAGLTFIGHPFAYRKEINSFERVYVKGKLVRQIKAPPIKLPGFLMYVKDCLLTFWWIWKLPKKVDLYVGSDGFSSFVGLMLKKIGKIKSVVLYTIDFMPKRFDSGILNWLYHYFDEQCLKHCSAVWNLSDKMAQGREEYMKVKRDEFVPQITVPLGIWDKRIPKPKLNLRNRYQIVFMGHILEKQGLDIVIEALPKILRKIPKTQLLIIGTGEYEKILKAKVKKLSLEKSVIFAGFIESHKNVERKLSESILAVATYKPDPDSFTYFADPGKIKNYLSAGLPVILTRVPPIAGEIEKEKCAVITNYNSDDFSKIAIKFLSSARILKQYSKNATAYAKNFDWENVFSKALVKTL